MQRKKIGGKILRLDGKDNVAEVANRAVTCKSLLLALKVKVATFKKVLSYYTAVVVVSLLAV